MYVLNNVWIYTSRQISNGYPTLVKCQETGIASSAGWRGHRPRCQTRSYTCFNVDTRVAYPTNPILGFFELQSESLFPHSRIRLYSLWVMPQHLRYQKCAKPLSTCRLWEGCTCRSVVTVNLEHVCRLDVKDILYQSSLPIASNCEGFPDTQPNSRSLCTHHSQKPPFGSDLLSLVLASVAISHLASGICQCVKVTLVAGYGNQQRY